MHVKPRVSVPLMYFASCVVFCLFVLTSVNRVCTVLFSHAPISTCCVYIWLIGCRQSLQSAALGVSADVCLHRLVTVIVDSFIQQQRHKGWLSSMWCSLVQVMEQFLTVTIRGKCWSLWLSSTKTSFVTFFDIMIMSYKANCGKEGFTVMLIVSRD